MAGLLGEVDINIASRVPLRTVKIESRRKTRILSPPASQTKRLPLPEPKEEEKPISMLSTPPLEHNDDGAKDLMSGMDDDFLLPSDPVPSSPAANAADRKVQNRVKVEEQEDDDMMEVAQAIGDDNIKARSINMSGSRPIIKAPITSAYPSPVSSSPTQPPVSDVDASTWNDVTSRLNVISSQETNSFGKLAIEDAVEQDGSLHIFWTDYSEINGNLSLFGKVHDKKSGAYVSAFVNIENILRKLYFLPRTYKQSKL